MSKSVESHPEEWDEALDGVEAAPNSHAVVHEDDKVRVLLVTMAPGAKEPEHHHRRSSLFIVFQSTPLLYHQRGEEPFEIPPREASAEKPYVEFLGPEGLHSVDNLSPNESYMAYRIEYKK